MPFAKIIRPTKAKKSKMVSLRLTHEEETDIDRLKKDLQFDSMRDLVLFSISVVGKLYEWECEKYRFYIGKAKKRDFREVEFEFEPLS